MPEITDGPSTGRRSASGGLHELKVLLGVSEFFPEGDFLLIAFDSSDQFGIRRQDDGAGEAGDLKSLSNFLVLVGVEMDGNEGLVDVASHLRLAEGFLFKFFAVMAPVRAKHDEDRLVLGGGDLGGRREVDLPMNFGVGSGCRRDQIPKRRLRNCCDPHDSGQAKHHCDRPKIVSCHRVGTFSSDVW